MKRGYMTPEIAAAFAEVRKEHPDVQIVVFFPDSRWLYFDSENESPAFSDRIDVGKLEDAADSVDYVPSVFHVDDKVR